MRREIPPPASMGALLLGSVSDGRMGQSAPAQWPSMSVEILEGDCRAILPSLAAESVHCVVTSPPYWGLRDYGTATWDGGDLGCDHAESRPTRTAASRASSTLGGSTETVHASHVYRGDCLRCGARRLDAQLGLEPTPEEYLERMVEVFREVRRVLRADGTCWVNMGDGYASGEVGRHDSVQANNGRAWNGTRKATVRQHLDLETGLKPKDLVGMPWRLAFALQADGWYLRADCIWAKPNPMPESVTDRPTKAHEYVFLLTKSARYFYDADAVREPHSRPWWEESVGPEYMTVEDGRNDGGKRKGNGNPLGRNLRTVWTIASEPTPDAHFATFPQALAARCILAGCPAGGTVFDPFAGTGTVGQVAERLGRHSILIELNPRYIELLRARTAQRGLFTWRPALAEPAP